MSKRKDQEAAEGLETVSNQVPASRFQKEQQVQNTSDAMHVDVPESSFTLNKKEGKGSQLKQEAVAKVLNSGDTGGVPGMGISAAGTRGLSGGAGGVLGAANATPIADKSRSETRYGKKLDRIATKINYTPSEQVVAEYDESKPLADSVDQDQGYNGTYRNEYARSQKVVGNTPAELLFDRSVDLIEKDELYFSQGQYVKQTGANIVDTPTKEPVLKKSGDYEYPRGNKKNFNAPSGNYLHRSVTIGLDSSGRVKKCVFDVYDLTPSVDADTANRSAANAMIDRNSAEIDRQNMDAKAGDEKADVWTPLARAIEEPTQVAALLRDYEAITGAEVLTGYRKTMTGMAFQLNKAVKDGIKLVSPAVEAILGSLYSANASDVLVDESAYPALDDLLDKSKASVKAINALGNPGLMIALYDSVAKYKTKQDIVLQPRGFRMHLQTADNNMNPLRVNKNFAKVYSATEAYSTIDRAYDPLLPICMTDKAALIHRRSLQQVAGFDTVLYGHTFSSAVSGGTEFAELPIGINSQPINDWYVHIVIDDNTEGHGAYTYSNGVFTPTNAIDADVSMRVVFDNSPDQHDGAEGDGHDAAIKIDGVTYYEQQSPVLVNLINVGDLRVKVPKADVDDAVYVKAYALDGGAYRYMYSDLRNNYVVRAGIPLIDGLIQYLEQDVGSKLYNLLPATTGTSDRFITIPMTHCTDGFSLWSLFLCAATPFIINCRTNDMKDVLYYEKNVEYPFSGLDTIGEIGVKSFTNFSCEGYDSPLTCGTMKESTAIRWVMPEMFWVAGQKSNSNKGVSETTVVMPFYMSENNYHIASNGAVTLATDQAAMSMPSIRSGARLSFLDKFYAMTEKDIRLSYDCVVPFIPLMADSGFSYKYAKNADGIIGFVLSDTTGTVNSNADITINEWLTQPRELGWSIDAPYGLLTAKVTNSVTAGSGAADFAGMYESATRGSSYRVKYWFGANAIAHVSGSGSQEILKNEAVNINRAANFDQNWYMVVANGKHPNVDHGMIFSLNRLLTGGSVVLGESKFKPFCIEAGNTVLNVEAISMMKAMWTRIQKLPFVISPFEGGDYVKGTASATIALTYDPYEIAYLFGLCGFRASDYRESVYNREKEAVNQGYLFVVDPWISSSPIFREGGIASGIPASKGYEI